MKTPKGNGLGKKFKILKKWVMLTHKYIGIRVVISEPSLINPLGLSLVYKKSKGNGVWLVYKDMCKNDIEKTKEILINWFEKSLGDTVERKDNRFIIKAHKNPIALK